MPTDKGTFKGYNNQRFSKKGHTDKKISVCIPCRKGIFLDTEYVWVRDLGYVHKLCKEELDAA